MSRSTRTAGRTAVALRLAVGVGHALRVVRGSRTPVLDTVLAVRQVGQAVVVGRSGTSDSRTASAAVDTLHAASMVPVALVGGRLRRFATAQLLLAVVLAVAEVTAVGRGRRA